MNQRECEEDGQEECVDDYAIYHVMTQGRVYLDAARGTIHELSEKKCDGGLLCQSGECPMLLQ